MSYKVSIQESIVLWVIMIVTAIVGSVVEYHYGFMHKLLDMIFGG